MEEKINTEAVATSVAKDGRYLPRFSYSKLSCLDHCPFAYKLQYIDKNYYMEDTLATELGTLVHFIEESIARAIMKHEAIDYEKLKDLFINIEQKPCDGSIDLVNGTQKSEQDAINGIKILQEKYQTEFFQMDESGNSYYLKCLDYLEHGIYRLENYLKENPDLEIYDVEHKFSTIYNDKIICYGFIDRIFRNTKTNEFIIEDIKTKGKPFGDKDLTTPLQFIMYSIGLKQELNLPDYPTTFYYDLPFCNLKQKAGTKGCINRGLKKIDKLLSTNEDFKVTGYVPKPSPLCYWCVFSHTNPRQPEEAKFKCPYFSLWKPNGTAKSFEVMNKWEGVESHELILRKFKLEQQGPGKDWPNVYADFDF